MKVTPQTPSALLPPAASSRPAATPASAAGAAVQAVPQGGVRLSATACALGRTAARAEGDFDAARVAAMRQAIADGSFRVNAQAVADRLLDNAAEFLTHR